LERIGFRRNASGAVAEMLPFPAIYEGQRVPWYASKIFIALVIGGSLLLALLTVVLWPVAVIIRKRYQRPLFSTESDRVLYFLSRIVCLGEVLFLLAPIVVLSQGLEHIVILGDGSLCQTAGARALVSRSRNSFSDGRNRIRSVCMAIPFSRYIAEILTGAPPR
jgi:hypothetical protein